MKTQQNLRKPMILSILRENDPVCYQEQAMQFVTRLVPWLSVSMDAFWDGFGHFEASAVEFFLILSHNLPLQFLPEHRAWISESFVKILSKIAPAAVIKEVLPEAAVSRMRIQWGSFYQNQPKIILRYPKPFFFFGGPTWTS